MSKMLLSINPQHVVNILSGVKKFEFRKVRCRREVESILIYATSPEMKVVGEARVLQIIEDAPEEVWELTRHESGISYDFFSDYFSGHDTAIAYHLDNVQVFPEPKDLADFGLTHAPQSFAYVA